RVEDICFNWWISNVNPDYDWGPQWADNYRYFHNGNLGTPTGDPNRYFVMSNGEQDYDQAWCAIDHSHQGWLPPPDFVGDFANGFDTRHLVSFGPFDIHPGEVASIALAIVGGENWHVNPDDAQQFLENPEDSNVVREFYSRLNFDDILHNSDVAFQVHQDSFRSVPPGPPRNFRADYWDHQRVVLKWNKRNLYNLQSYNIYRSTESGHYGGSPITPAGLTDTTFIDTEVENDVLYYYVITTTNTDRVEGGCSREVYARVGWPEPPLGLVAEGGNQEVTLSWQRNTEDDLSGYIIHRSVAGEAFAAVDSTDLEPSYHQQNLENAVILNYYITAVDTLGHESFASDTVWACPMAFDSGILLVDDTRDNGSFIPPPYAVNYLYFRALREYPVGNWHYASRHAPLLRDLSPYSTVVWFNETTGAAQLPRETMADYLKAGGNLVLIGWRGLFTWQSPFDEGDFAHDYLKIVSVDYPRWVPGRATEFLGGTRQRPGYSDFQLSAARVDSLWPGLDGKLPWMGTLQADSFSEVLFRFNSDYPETSHYHNQPIGVGYFGEDYKTVVLNFPLYFVEEPTSIEILRKIIEEMGETQKREPEPEEPVPLPEEFALYHNYPNPFNYGTMIAYDVPEECQVQLTIYNILGQSVIALVDEVQPQSRQVIPWDGTDDEGEAVASGVYFYRLTATGFSEVKRMLLVK
ncbi:MAG: T9SS type A sorting domain-containing protein, partial [Candidatus Zixiibacteriota bacterium]